VARVTARFGFYAILTSPERGYEYVAELCVEREIAFLQLRMKDAPEDSVVRTARRLRDITRGSRTRLIINDLPHVAAEVGADGVHIGQNDMPHDQARTIVGPDAIVGISTHSPEQTRAACRLGPDYIGIGPVFPTPTKKVPDPAIGIDGMREMLSLATVPAVVLGSITPQNLPEILAAGAGNFAMVRPLNRTPDPAQVLNTIRAICARHRG
jgi:thiamine-phosphate pyrophosphorylase